MRKSSKERRGLHVQAQRITLAEAAIAIKSKPSVTLSATMPAYPFTCLCPDPALRDPLVKRRKVYHETRR